MRKSHLIVFAIIFGGITSTNFAQDQLTKDFAPIKSELQSWDPVRGEWLAESMLAISRKQPIPDRTFPEDFTPAEMYKMVPSTSRDRIATTVNGNRNNIENTFNRQEWVQISDLINRSNCQPSKGRSYGDPHLSTFDGKSFSLQTVGEFILAQSLNGQVQVQTRQRPEGEDFSLNTAVAMNVSGDRVCIYADDQPDNEVDNPLRVDGRVVRLTGSNVYYLPHGGTVRNSGNQYVVTWPTGESVTAQITNRTSFNFMNVTTQIYPCINGGYEGLLGNANGSPSDDINTRNNRNANMESANRFGTAFGVPNSTLSNEAEKEYLFYLAKEYGSAWRVTQMNTLFDYRPGQNTEYFTDYSFPRYHRTVRDLSQAQRDAARRDCENNGIRGNELDGCIFDRGHIGLTPTRQPEIIDRTAGFVLPVMQSGGRVLNVNPRQPETSSSSTKPVVIGGESKQPGVKPVNPAKPDVIGSEPKAPPIENPTPLIQSKPVGSGENVGSTKPTETKSPVLPVANEPIVSPKPIENKPVEKPKPVYESKPIENKVVEKPKEVNEIQSVVKPTPAPKPSTPAPKPIESKPVIQPSTPVKVATPTPAPTTKPAISKPR
jgi:hypothetical protein